MIDFLRISGIPNNRWLENFNQKAWLPTSNQYDSKILFHQLIDFELIQTETHT